MPRLLEVLDVFLVFGAEVFVQVLSGIRVCRSVYVNRLP